MSRKTHKITAVILSTAIVFAFASSEMSGAFAQEDATIILPETTQEVAAGAPAPVFVSTEIVQPVPDVVEEDIVPAVIAEPAPVAAPNASSLRDLVNKTSTDFSLSEQMRCLAGTVYFEARGEPLAGQLAVAKVVMNRSDDRRFPNSYCGVVYQRSQFSFVRGGSMPRINTASGAWKRAKAIARIAHEGQWDSAADDSLYFHAKYVRPSWSRKKAKRATINTHIFYR